MKFILSTNCIEITEDNADSDLSIFFKRRDNVSNPVWMLLLSNEATFDEFLNFDFDYFHDVRSILSLLLLNQFSIRFNIEMLHCHLRIEARHIFIVPGKDVNILSLRDTRSCFSIDDRILLIEMSFGSA